ncbi:MAG TPA: hypothetical protein VGV09_06425 [Steroidobacteraceae bacterium]|nr:hypothetical protein [Steroidobacteraceae bacterium]
MINRREFLEAAAISALPAMTRAAQGAPSVQIRASVAALHSVVVDSRHAEARSLGAGLAAQGANVVALADGDVTQLWLRTIGPAWRSQSVPIGGLTTRSSLFCLEQLSLGHGLRVVFHAEHIVHSEGRTEHRVLRGADAAGLCARSLGLAGSLWPTRIAEVLAHPGRFAGRERQGLSDAALSPTLPPGATLLTSWIIAA